MKIHFTILIAILFLFAGCTVAHRPPYREPPTQDTPPQSYVEICHQDRETLSIPYFELNYHLRHGDYRGPCRTRQLPDHAHRDREPPQRFDPPPQVRNPAPHHNKNTVIICFNGRTMQVHRSVARNYIKRGARRGKCPIPKRQQPDHHSDYPVSEPTTPYRPIRPMPERSKPDERRKPVSPKPYEPRKPIPQPKPYQPRKPVPEQPKPYEPRKPVPEQPKPYEPRKPVPEQPKPYEPRKPMPEQPKPYEPGKPETEQPKYD